MGVCHNFSLLTDILVRISLTLLEAPDSNFHLYSNESWPVCRRQIGLGQPDKVLLEHQVYRKEGVTVKVKVADLRDKVLAGVAKLGYKDEDAKTIADVLL